MPGQGRTQARSYSQPELDAIQAGAAALGLSLDQALDILGRDTLDVFLNGEAYWRNVPTGVWGYYIGGYQVVKKWLSYREKSVLGRGLKMEEAEYVTEMTRRLGAICLLQPALDANYQGVKASTYAWPQGR